MSKIKCPNCRKSHFYFDSPSLFIYSLIYDNGMFYFVNNETERRLKKSPERVSVFEKEITEIVWCWTCLNCDEAIEYDMREWLQLQQEALEYLRDERN